MTNDNTLSTDDPRLGLAVTTGAVRDLFEAVEALPAEALAGPTPCPDFTVADILDHMTIVMRRVAVIGDGGHWSDVSDEPIGSGWAKEFQTAAGDAHAAWSDPAKLGQQFEVPWGTLPGAAIVASFTGELAVHGWDVATATDRPLVIEDAALGAAMEAALYIPAEGRDTPEMPFSPVVEPGPDAPLLDRLAGWMGRQVA